MANRARWMMKYEKGLVDILHENNTSHYRTQNGWRTEGWRKIVRDFNVRYPEAKFSKMQIQEHETQLKKDYKLIKSILQRDGVSWDQSASMVRTTDEIWDDIIEDMPKARKYQSKSFPLLDSLELLFDGPIPEGGQKSPSSVPQNVGENVDDGGNNTSTVPALGPQGIDDLDTLQKRGEEVLERLQHGADRRLPRADDQAQSSSCVELQRDRRKKRKAPDVQQMMETYLNFRMKQAHVKEQRAKDAGQFTISGCIKALHTMADVSDEVKVLASDVFKDAENREIFLSYEPRLRSLWLKREVGKLLS
uniref:Myb/SANT-like domain-containing protein n=1 Tax=Zea mays TaxID=4577 RepID=A0A804RLX5_MAIZE